MQQIDIEVFESWNKWFQTDRTFRWTLGPDGGQMKRPFKGVLCKKYFCQNPFLPQGTSSRIAYFYTSNPFTILSKKVASSVNFSIKTTNVQHVQCRCVNIELTLQQSAYVAWHVAHCHARDGQSPRHKAYVVMEFRLFTSNLSVLSTLTLLANNRS